MTQEHMTAEEFKRAAAGEHVPRKYAANPSLRSLVVVVPIPPQETHPNKRVGHWSKKSKAVKAQRCDAGLAAKHALQELHSGPPMWRKATIQATYHRPHPNARRSDHTNLLGWLKPTEDGLQDAGVLANDQGVTWLPPVELLGEDASGSQVVLTITSNVE